MLDWSRFDHIVEQGYRYAREQLTATGMRAGSAGATAK
jgi:hypothetical protein